MDKIEISEYVRRMTTSELERAFSSIYLTAEDKIMIAHEYWNRTRKPITNLFRY